MLVELRDLDELRVPRYPRLGTPSIIPSTPRYYLLSFVAPLPTLPHTHPALLRLLGSEVVPYSVPFGLVWPQLLLLAAIHRKLGV